MAGSRRCKGHGPVHLHLPVLIYIGPPQGVYLVERRVAGGGPHADGRPVLQEGDQDGVAPGASGEEERRPPVFVPHLDAAPGPDQGLDGADLAVKRGDVHGGGAALVPGVDLRPAPEEQLQYADVPEANDNSTHGGARREGRQPGRAVRGGLGGTVPCTLRP